MLRDVLGAGFRVFRSLPRDFSADRVLGFRVWKAACLGESSRSVGLSGFGGFTGFWCVGVPANKHLSFFTVMSQALHQIRVPKTS